LPTATAGKVEGAIVSGVVETTTAVAVDAVCAGLLLSVTVAVKLDVPD
jgi:hypothetical protein